MTNQQNQSPYILVNTFTAIQGGIDALSAFQLTEMQDLRDEATEHGWLSNEVYQSQDGASLIVITRFLSEEAKNSWGRTERFRRHVEALEPLVQNVTSIPVTFLAAHGQSVMIQE
ncbi:hypothetical protein CKW39_10625 [Kocuria sp. WRN011]|uniref:antibiotic biosynthesis monooxygenase n=1 Tax=Kocuria sp. WRN011 TaxID=2029858 RepID=UPI000BAFAB8C|nr:antibiotic biosynthesis monooxygenase [Kocuria sp. WRN011]PBB08249.1 hypothetical protein CKW39_10625 [Kocuria sp. WRN011]